MRYITWRNSCIIFLVLLFGMSAYVIEQNLRFRGPDTQAMSVPPNELSMALHAYQAEYGNQASKPSYYEPGRPSVDMALSAFEAAEPLYQRYSIDTSYIRSFLSDMVHDSSDPAVYHELSAIKSYLRDTYMKPTEIERLFDAMRREYKNIHHIQ